MTITELLRRQHESFRRLLNSIGEELREEGPASNMRVERLLSKLLPLLAAHEEVENDILFPAVQSAPGGASNEVLATFSEAHEEVHAKVDEFQRALGRPGAVLTRMVSAADFISLLREHMEEEDETLFPYVERLLPAAQQVELGDAARRHTAAVFANAESKEDA